MDLLVNKVSPGELVRIENCWGRGVTGYCTWCTRPDSAGMPADEMTGQCLPDPCPAAGWLAAILSYATRSVQEPVKRPCPLTARQVCLVGALIDLLPLGCEASCVVQIYTTAQGVTPRLSSLSSPVSSARRQVCSVTDVSWIEAGPRSGCFVSLRLILSGFQRR